MMTFPTGFVLGMIGGAIPEVLAVYHIRKTSTENRPKWLKSAFYWLVTLVMVAAGGGLVCFYLYCNVDVKIPMAIHLGATAPVTLLALKNGKGNIADES